MKATGIVRRIDELGRIVIPKELRRTMGLAEDDPMEIFVDGEQIILQKYKAGCIFCGDAKDTLDMSGKPVCVACARHIAEALR